MSGTIRMSEAEAIKRGIIPPPPPPPPPSPSSKLPLSDRRAQLGSAAFIYILVWMFGWAIGFVMGLVM